MAEIIIIGEVGASAVGGNEVGAAVVGDVSARVATITGVARTRRHLAAFVVVNSGGRQVTAIGVVMTADIDARIATPTVEAITVDSVAPPAIPAADPVEDEAVRQRVANGGIRGAMEERAAVW